MTCWGRSRARRSASCSRWRRRCGAWRAGATPAARRAARTSSPSDSRRCRIPTAAAPARRPGAAPRGARRAPERSSARAMNAPAPSGVITITTDFGHQGPFVGVMKGIILTRFPTARIVDLTHEIVVHWPAEAGFWLARAYAYFPPGTVHIAVVDPGVGTARSIVAVQAGGHYFIAPDNGLLAPVVSRVAGAQIVRLTTAG